MQSPNIITLTCPSCGGKVSIEEGASRFTCSYCGNEHLIQFNVQPVAPSSVPIRPKVSMPGTMEVGLGEDSARRITRRWFSPKYIFLAFFTVIWDGFLLFWYSIAGGIGAPAIALIFPLFHVAVGAYLTYSTLAGFLNRTIVELDHESLRMWSEPLPWPGSKTIPIAQVRQLFCKEKISHGKNSTTVTYDLYAIDQSDQQVRLLTGMSSPDEAQFLEQQLEAWMRIKDQRVAGEYR